jgi:hypothetical protein
MHIHHGLSPHAEAWVAHCEACVRRGRSRSSLSA